MDDKYTFDKKIFGNRIKQARKNRNMTQEALATLLNINVNTLAKCESPKNKLTFSYTNLISLVNVLGISIDFLFRTEQAEEEHSDTTQELNNLIEELTDRERNIVFSLINSLVENRNIID